MSNTVQFYYNPMSRAQTILWMLEETGAPYEVKILDWKKNAQKSAEFLAINPMGKIPTIVHRGVVVTEGAAICAYLADAFPEAGLAPALNSPDRGSYYRWLFFGSGCIDPAMADRAAPRVNGEKMKMVLGYGSFDATINTIEKAVSKDVFIAGPKFTAADLYIGSMLGFGMMFGAIPERPAFKLYVANLRQRPAYLRSQEKAQKYTSELQANA